MWDLPHAEQGDHFSPGGQLLEQHLIAVPKQPLHARLHPRGPATGELVEQREQLTAAEVPPSEPLHLQVSGEGVERPLHLQVSGEGVETIFGIILEC